MKTIQEFYNWENQSNDTIDVKRIYVDMAGDLIAGILLSQVIFWHLPDKHGHSKLRVRHDNKFWLAKTRESWKEECRINPRQYDRAIKILIDAKLIECQVFKFAGSPTVHIRLNEEAFLAQLKKMSVSSLSRIGDNQITDSGVPLTETTSKTTNNKKETSNLKANPESEKENVADSPNKGWNKAVFSIWREKCGGELPIHQLKAMKKLVDMFGWCKVKPAFEAYLAETEAMYVSVHSFASRFGIWESKVPKTVQAFGPR